MCCCYEIKIKYCELIRKNLNEVYIINIIYFFKGYLYLYFLFKLVIFVYFVYDVFK